MLLAGGGGRKLFWRFVIIMQVWGIAGLHIAGGTRLSGAIMKQAWAIARLHIAGWVGGVTGARGMFGPRPVTEPARKQPALLLDGRQEVADEM